MTAPKMSNSTVIEFQDSYRSQGIRDRMKGAVRELVGIESGVVSGVINLE